MTYDTWLKHDEALAASQKLEDDLAAAIDEAAAAKEIVWAIAERLAPEKLEGKNQRQLVAELISHGADGAAELLLEGAMPCQ